MPATARQIPVDESDLANEGGGGGAYAELEVPNDYEAVLKDVSDYDKRSEGKTFGWVFEYEVETPSGASVPFKTFLSMSKKARWKLIEVCEAHGVNLAEGLNDVDPNALVGDVIGVTIDFPRDKDTDEPTSDFREIRSHFALVELDDDGYMVEEPEII
jgi:hypothetical protein